MNEDFLASSELVSVRLFEPRDREAVIALLAAGVMHSHSAKPEVDLNLIIRGMATASCGKHRLWVSESFGRITGSTLVVSDDSLLAHLKCICVAREIAEPLAVARALAGRAIRDAWECGYIKLVVHTDLALDRLAAMFRELGFEFIRERAAGTDRVLEFYQNLYERPRRVQLGRGDEPVHSHDDGAASLEHRASASRRSPGSMSINPKEHQA